MSERSDKYAICADCAKKKGWVTAYPIGGNTVSLGLCYYCDRKDETELTPVCDYKTYPEERILWD